MIQSVHRERLHQRVVGAAVQVPRRIIRVAKLFLQAGGGATVFLARGVHELSERVIPVIDGRGETRPYPRLFGALVEVVVIVEVLVEHGAAGVAQGGAKFAGPFIELVGDGGAVGQSKFADQLGRSGIRPYRTVRVAEGSGG